MKTDYIRPGVDNAWCPGCGNFGILNLLQKVLKELDVDPRSMVFVSGIGQAAKTPQYIDTHMFNGLHGRALPVATGIKMANPGLNVVAEGGDGDMYGEGGNHFINAVRRNVNIVHIVHNNMVYGLTKGQASPTSERDFTTNVQVEGVHNEPFNPISTALALNATFVSRIYVWQKEHALEVLKEAFLHPGYALVDIFQPCVTFNKINSSKWFRENTYLLENHDSSDLTGAMQKSLEHHPFPLGIFYQSYRPTFEEWCWHKEKNPSPMYARKHDTQAIQDCFDALF